MEIKEIIKEIFIVLDKWHDLDYKIWDDYYEDNNDILYVVQKLAYHNYCGWHLHELYFENIKKNIIDGSVITDHNKKRNTCMESIDNYFTKNQNTEAKFHSEGFGSIVDRIVNDYIKYLHCLEYNDQRSEKLLYQVQLLTKIANELFDEVKNGTKQIIVWEKFKVQYE